jgi:hypothetical protein
MGFHILTSMNGELDAGCLTRPRDLVFGWFSKPVLYDLECLEDLELEVGPPFSTACKRRRVG